MSILIKGIEMPRRCEECRLCHYEEHGTIVWCGCRATMRIRPIDCYDKPDWCPLVEIPDKHGRLIDADAMCADLATVNPQYKVMIDWCIRITQAQPTVIGADYPPSTPLEQVWTELFGEDGE